MPEQRLKEEHVLVCLSSSPSNKRLIEKAAVLAKAFQGYFTALYIETPEDARMSEEDRQRLENNEKLAKKLGAKLEIIPGENVAYQIAEYTRVSGVTKLVIGRSVQEGRKGRGDRHFIDTLLMFVPDVDVYIIPDKRPRPAHEIPVRFPLKIKSGWPDFFFAILMLALCSVIACLVHMAGGAESSIVAFYILTVCLISVRTASWIYSLFAAGASVVIFNFLFTAPYYTLLAYDNRYTASFAVMFGIALLCGLLGAKQKLLARNASRMAFRIQVLYDMNQQLEKSGTSEEIIDLTAGQLCRLLQKNIVVYAAENGVLGEARVFASGRENAIDFVPADEREAAEKAFASMRKTGRGTGVMPDVHCIYYAVRLHEIGYGVIGIDVADRKLDPYADSIVVSILSEAAIALENKRNEEEKERARVMAKNEQLRADLLRSISHDLRTPLTSISGAASLLLSDEAKIDEAARRQLHTNIYDDAMWLEDLVENLLAITRLGEGQMKIHASTELVSEVIAEACRHVDRRISEHTLSVGQSSDLLLAKMDAHLIVQVIINLINNAVRYTPAGSHIRVYADREGGRIRIFVCDDGPGVAEEDREHIFEMFYSGKKKVADSRRSLGLGLALCKAVIQAHGGEISYTDNQPSGSVFLFTLEAEEVPSNE
uniref:histidine kinase n=1 Tax=Eubacterium cellulosolvens (strain ATCC 43171 / JCM 9499 / 6) TaxID=633697 RepID=I5AVL8_EUBC6